MPFSTTYANDILDYVFAKTSSLNAPTAVYIGLCTNNPEENGGTFYELSGKGYARVLISQKGFAYPDVINSASGRTISNGKQINWTKATDDWDRVNGFGLFSAPTGGAPFFYGKIELSDQDQANGGLLCEAGAVMLFDPFSLQVTFPANDVAAAQATTE